MSYHFCWKGYVYVAWKSGQSQVVLGVTPWPILDLAYHHKTRGCDQLICLTPELPIGLASYLGSELSGQQLHHPVILELEEISKLPGGWGPFRLVKQLQLKLGKESSPDVQVLVDYLQDQAAKLLAREELPAGGQQFAAQEADQVDLSLTSDGELLIQAIQGKLLFPREILQAVADNHLEGWTPFQLKVLLQLSYLQGHCELEPGVIYMGQGEYKCGRCGSKDKLHQINCLDCGDTCVYCEECQSMGESRLCRPLYGVAGLPWDQPQEEIQPQLGFQLTQAQQDAANQLLRAMEGPGEKALVWAVCGAGKTEVAFPAIAQVLSRGGQVLFAIPRRDVVLELIPRLERAFPQVTISSLYGGSQGKYYRAQLVLATTHQVLRFYHQFDLVVLDEVDAYPYKDSAMLHQGVERARKPGGRQVVMTATPTSQMLQQAKGDKVDLIHIPARHHGYPVPVPKLLTGNHCKVQEGGPMVFSKEVLDFIHQTIEGDLAQLFIFTPSLFLTEQVGTSLQQRMKLPPFNDFQGDWVNYSHSRDPKRDQKRIDFVAGEYPVFVTTTIMERGVTIARANVLVLFANYQQIFDPGTLVQMAGRAGRSSVYPLAKVLLVGEKVSPAMEEAIKMIQLQNKIAEERGYLRQASMIASTREGRS